MLLKANNNLILPDGKTEIKIGETFVYEGDIHQFKSCITIVEDQRKKKAEKKLNITSPIEKKRFAKKSKN